MKFYHHTDPKYLPSIFEKGLLARPWHAPEEGMNAFFSAILHNRDVVWLTTQPSTETTEADVAWARRRGFDDMTAEKHWMERANGNTVRLAVNIPKHSKRLAHFRTWIRKNPTVIVFEDGSARCNNAGDLMTTANITANILDCAPPSSALWYVHFGDVPPKRIEVA